MLSACTDEYLSANVIKFIPAPNQVSAEIALYTFELPITQQKAAAGVVCRARVLPAQSGRRSTNFWDVEMRQSLCLNV